MRGGQLVDELGPFDRGTPDDDPSRPGLKTRQGIFECAYAPAGLHPNIDRVAYGADRVQVRLPSVQCGVEIDDVDPLCARVGEATRDGDRVVVVHGLQRVVAAQEPHDFAFAHVDRRIEVHYAASTKFWRSCKPTALDFSG